MISSWINLLPILKRLFSYGKPHKKTLYVAMFFLWSAVILEAICPIIISYFIDNVIAKKLYLIFLSVKLITGFLILQFFSAALHYYQSLLFNKVAFFIVQKLRMEVMEIIFQQPVSIFDAQPIGQFVSKITNDTEVIKDLYVTVIASILRSVSLIAAIFIAMFLLSWKLACISLILFPILFFVICLYQHYSTPIVRQLRSYVAEIHNGFNEIINGMDVIQQFLQQERFRNKIQKASYAHFKSRMKILRLDGYLLRPFLSFIFSLILCAILLEFSSNLYGEIGGVGILYAFINYLGRLNEPIIELTSKQSLIQQAIVAGERIFELIDSPIQNYGKDSYPLITGSIALKNLSFSYFHKKNSPILKNVTFSIPNKSFIALVGKTGSGKSTIANLIMGFYPTDKKTIFLDHRPIETLSYKVLRKGIAIVQQEPIIMSDTIYANIVLDRKTDEKKVWKALKKVQLDTLVQKLPYGLWTELGEKGNVLSVGQKQLLALARVFISTPVILILDEVTANIDPEIEKIISNVLKIIRKYMTIIVIAHRLSTIVDADQIFFLKNGEIIEQGTHNFLMEKRGQYFNMYYVQKKRKDSIFSEF